MLKSTLTFLFLVGSLILRGQSVSKTNLDFEQISHSQPAGWTTTGSSDYLVSLDSVTVRHGKYSVSIEAKDANQRFKAWVLTLPHNYSGFRLTLSAFIKTEKVTEGYAGLWLRIDPDIAFDNMSRSGVKGTTDWTKYEITADLNPGRTKRIVIGGLLAGKGKMWMDDLRVTVDGKDIDLLTPFERKEFPAERDTTFDKGSRIGDFSPGQREIENLSVLGRVWGFLKYYHPRIGQGDFNWDYELFRILPGVLHTDAAIRDRLLVDWINGFGVIVESKPPKFDLINIKLVPDLNWITASSLSGELTALLQKIRDAPRPPEHYYIGLQRGARNPDFKNENPYPTMKYPDAGFRLLALFRYWNIIQYYFPYRNLLDEDWKEVPEEFIPKVVAAHDERAYLLAMLELIARVHDTHANIWSFHPVLNEFRGVNSPAVELTFVDDKAVVSGYPDARLGKESGLLRGDIITGIQGKPVDSIMKKALKFTTASNRPTQWREIAPALLRTNDTIVNVEFIRGTRRETRTLKAVAATRLKIKNNFYVQDTCFQLVRADIAYLNNGTLKRSYLPELWKKIRGTKGLIIDLRNYPSDTPGYDLCNYLMPVRRAFAKSAVGSVQQPGLFTFTDPARAGRKNADYYKGKVVILINEITQSASEFHAMMYRVCPEATVMGSTTAGADGNVSSFSLPGGIRTMISGVGVYYPDGKETQRIGIVPDIEVHPTVEGIRDGRDEVLERAIAFIAGK